MSLLKTRKLRYTVIVALCILLITFCIDNVCAVQQDELFKDVKEPTEVSVESAKSGLLEIVTGMSEGESFKKAKQCNGLLVSNSENGVYIITTYSGVQLSNKEKKKANDSDQAQKSMRVIVRGDVSAELTEINSSKKKDFCILQADSVINEKNVVSLDVGSKPAKDQTITVLGFPSEDENGTSLQYEAQDVETHTGKIKDIVNTNGSSFIYHTGTIRNSSDGSMLVGDDGYVIGLNSVSKSNDDTSVSTSIVEIAKVLDNYGIPYSSDKTTELYRELYDRCQKACKQLQQSGYKAESKEAVERQVENGTTVLRESPYDPEKLQEANELLKDAQNKLEKKISKLIYIIILLGLVIVFLTIRLIKLYRWRKRNNISAKKDVRKEKSKHNKRSEKNKAFDSIRPEKTEIIKRSRPGEYERHEQGRKAFLYWNRNDRDVPIDKDVFFIGKKEGTTDLTIADNRAVSRDHAVIKRTSSGYVLIDNDSANGTYVNDMPIAKNGVLLRDGDLICFANEKFVFELR